MRLVIRILAPLALLLAFMSPAGPAVAAPAESVRFYDFAFDFNNCNGEAIEGQGTVHTVSKVQTDGRFLFHFDLHAQGIGSLGNEYVMIWNGYERSDQDGFTLVQHIHAISKGSAPNQEVIFLGDDENGFSFEVDCTP